MLPTRQGSFRLFRFQGIDVFIHWSWFLLVLYVYQAWGRSAGGHAYSSGVWNALEFLSLFVIVLMHEFGHALACRQVGGRANQIVLWPLGGVAYVAPPQRPGATLWSIAAGPLVNVVLFPILTGFWMLARSAGWGETRQDLYFFTESVWAINTGLLLFNLLPIYPLDGGQILRSLLWFLFGRARSLMIAIVIGFIGVAGFIPLIVTQHEPWYYLMAAFVVLNLWQGFRHAQALFRLARLPRRGGFACPHCKTSPPIGSFWVCSRCRQAFDTFETRAMCPHCGAQYPITACLDCGEPAAFEDWQAGATVPPRM